MQSTIRAMLIAVAILVIFTVTYQMITGQDPANLGPEPTPPPTNVSTGGSVSYVPSITVADQGLSSKNVIVVAKVVVPNNGWVSVHVDAGGSPVNGYIGYLMVKRGSNSNLKVTLKDTSRLTATMWVMLHADGGTRGKFEFPGGDAVIRSSNGTAIVASFRLTR